VPLEVDERCVREAAWLGARSGARWRDREVLEFLAEHDDRLLRQERICARREVVGLRFREVRLRGVQARRGVGAIEVVRRLAEEVKDKIEAVGVKLIAEAGG
jgi:hypothetical protein